MANSEALALVTGIRDELRSIQENIGFDLALEDDSGLAALRALLQSVEAKVDDLGGLLTEDVADA